MVMVMLWEMPQSVNGQLTLVLAHESHRLALARSIAELVDEGAIFVSRMGWKLAGLHPYSQF